MRIIKFYAWEKSFLAKLMDLRAAELKIVRFLLIMRSAVNAVAVSVCALRDNNCSADLQDACVCKYFGLRYVLA